MAVTISDVAKKANVSKGTVSNYLTGKKKISKEKVNIIQSSIKELGYEVNLEARSFRTNKYGRIGVLVPSFAGSFYVEILSSIQKELDKRGFVMMPMSYEDDVQKMNEQLAYLQKVTDGIICVPVFNDGNYDEFYKSLIEKKPVLTINVALGGVECDCVLSDFEEGLYFAVKHCLEQGHREIGFLLGPKGRYTPKDQLAGARRAYSEFRLELCDKNVRFTTQFKDVEIEECQNLLESNPDITVICASNYRNTIGVLWELREQNLKNKISVIGFGVDEIAHIIDPPISYITYKKGEIADKTVNLILDRLGDFSKPKTKAQVEAYVENIEAIKRLK